MTDDKWDVLIEQAKVNFEDVSVFTEDLMVETEDGPVRHGPVRHGTQDVLEFSTDHGAFRVVRENRSRMLEKKTHHFNRQNDTSESEYTFSDSEMTHKLRIFALDEDDQYRELESENLNIFTDK
jgi:hypothetical protein